MMVESSSVVTVKELEQFAIVSARHLNASFIQLILYVYIGPSIAIVTVHTRPSKIIVSKAQGLQLCHQFSFT